MKYQYEEFYIKKPCRIGARQKKYGKWFDAWWYSKHWKLRKNMKFGHSFTEKKSLINQVKAHLTGNTLRRTQC